MDAFPYVQSYECKKQPNPTHSLNHSHKFFTVSLKFICCFMDEVYNHSLP